LLDIIYIYSNAQRRIIAADKANTNAIPRLAFSKPGFAAEADVVAAPADVDKGPEAAVTAFEDDSPMLLVLVAVTLAEIVSSMVPELTTTPADAALSTSPSIVTAEPPFESVQVLLDPPTM